MAALTLTLYAMRLGATPIQLGLIGMMWPATYTVSCLFTGPLSDRLPRRLLPICGCIIAGISYSLAIKASIPFHIILIGIPAGISFALFWPPLEAWLADLSPARDLRRNFGIFNIAWSTGAAPGPFLAGLAIGVGVTFSLAISVALIAIAGIMVAVKGGIDGKEDRTSIPTEDEVRSRRFLHLAWVANFATWFTIGIIRSLFPKLAEGMGMGSPSIGVLLSVITCSQVGVFALLARTSSWHYRLTPLIFSQFVLLVVSMLMYSQSDFFILIMVMVLMGGCTGICYFSSIYYSLNTPTARGVRSGIHEALIGLGIVAGPLTGGIVAQQWGLRTPYLLSALVTIVGMVLIIVMVARIRLGDDRADEMDGSREGS